MRTLRIERITEENTRAFLPWCTVTSGPWIVTGTDDVEEAREFVAEFLKSAELPLHGFEIKA